MSSSDLFIPRDETMWPHYFQNRIINYNVLSPNFHIHVSVSHLYIPRIGLPILLQPNRQIGRPILGTYKIAHIYMNVEIANKGRAVSFLGIHKSDFRYSVGKHPGICWGYVGQVYSI